jgi:metallo-beta-lactamase family protein
MKITFCGAAGVVTGSCTLLETGKDKILVDCGMFQGTKEVTRLNYLPFRFNPASVSAVILTHAHVDHCGLLPKLVKDGFRGRVVGTGATLDLAEILLEDSAHVQKQETEHENKRRMRTGLEPRKPLYTVEEARTVTGHFYPAGYGEAVGVSKGMSVTFRDAGHILGSSILEIAFAENGRAKKLVHSGDLGQWNVPIVRDPTIVGDADLLFIESTYGDRVHGRSGGREAKLQEVIAAAFKKGGKLLIPAFSVERTQELLYSIKRMAKAGKLPGQKIFLDSPLAIRATKIFMRHRECFDREALETFTRMDDIPGLEPCMTSEDSMKINSHQGPCIVIAGSGMCNAGRIRHHLKHGLWDPKNTVLFVGYQATGTLGRVILDGAREVRMMGMSIAVRAGVEKIEGFSAHADADELARWAGGFVKRPARTFVVHGEPHAAEALSKRLAGLGFDCRIPALGEECEA